MPEKMDGAVIAGRAIPTPSSLMPQPFQFGSTTVPASFSFLPFLSNGLQSEARAVSAEGTQATWSPEQKIRPKEI